MLSFGHVWSGLALRPEAVGVAFTGSLDLEAHGVGIGLGLELNAYGPGYLDG